MIAHIYTSLGLGCILLVLSHGAVVPNKDMVPNNGHFGAMKGEGNGDIQSNEAREAMKAFMEGLEKSQEDNAASSSKSGTQSVEIVQNDGSNYIKPSQQIEKDSNEEVKSPYSDEELNALRSEILGKYMPHKDLAAQDESKPKERNNYTKNIDRLQEEINQNLNDNENYIRPIQIAVKAMIDAVERNMVESFQFGSNKASATSRESVWNQPSFNDFQDGGLSQEDANSPEEAEKELKELQNAFQQNNGNENGFRREAGPGNKDMGNTPEATGHSTSGGKMQTAGIKAPVTKDRKAHFTSESKPLPPKQTLLGHGDDSEDFS